MRFAAPRIAAIVGHSDEFAVLEACIAHHERAGVTSFYVSADAEAVRGQPGLDALERRGNVRVVYREETDADGFAFLSSSVEAVTAWARPDWILIIDSDEFCMSRGGDLRVARDLDDAGVLRITRLNVALVRGPAGDVRAPNLARAVDLPLVARTAPVDLTDYSETMSPPWIMSAIAPKLMLRPEAVQSIRLGGHAAVPRDAAAEQRAAKGLVIAHASFTTFERFSRKIERIRTGLVRFGHLFAPTEALHWRRWADIAERGRLDVEFRRQSFDEEAVRALLAEGVLVTAARYLART